MAEYLSADHKIANRSVPKLTLTSGVISSNVACFWLDNGYAAIFNRSIPYTRYFINGIETETPTISMGDGFTDADCYYEGIETSYDMLLKCMGYNNGLGVKVDIEKQDGFCRNDGVANCTIRTTNVAKVTNASGDYSYYWEVTGASIKEGQGTDTIVVETTGLYGIKVGIRCTVTDRYTIGFDETTNLHQRQKYDDNVSVLVPYITLKPQTYLKPVGV